MIGYAFACLPPLLCFGLPLHYLLRNEWPRLRQMLFFPLAGQMRPGQNIQRARLLRRLNGVEVSLPTADGRVVHCVWAPGDAADRDGGPAVLLLHANAMVLDDMADWAAYYLNLGAGVLLLTYWGYPDPAEDFTARDAYTGEPLAADGRTAPTSSQCTSTRRRRSASCSSARRSSARSCTASRWAAAPRRRSASATPG